MIVGRNIQKALEWSLHVSVYVCLLSRYRLSNCMPKITRACCALQSIDVINVYNVKILCKRVYYFVNVYLNKNHMSEAKQNYDGKPSYSALRSNRSLIEFIGSRC